MFPSFPDDMMKGSSTSLFSPFNMGGDENSTMRYIGIEPSFAMQLNACLKPASSNQEDEMLILDDCGDSDHSMGDSDFELPSLQPRSHLFFQERTRTLPLPAEGPTECSP